MGGGDTKKTIYIYIGGTCLKGGLGEFADLRDGTWQKRAMHFMQIISSHQAEFSYPAFFELVWLTLAPIDIYITYRSNIYMTSLNTRSN